MKLIAQIGDSGGMLPEKFLEEYNIKKVPFYITLDGSKYLVQGKEISDKELYEKMEEDPNLLPKTSAPNVNDWYQAFEEKYKEGYRKIIVTTISSKLSASNQNANVAKKEFLSDHKDCSIEIIDTLTCSAGQSAIELKIAQYIKEGIESFKELSEIAKKLIEKTTLVFTVKTLKYMEAGGRIGKAAKFLGILLKINPISEFVDGEVKPIKIERTRKSALNRMVEIITERIKDVQKITLFTRSALFEEDENYIINKLKESLNYQKEIYSGVLEAVIGVHAGPGAIGIAFTEF